MDTQRRDKITISEAINLDIIFLVDTSGSMANELDAVKKSCIDFANVIIRQNKKVRLGLIGFDIGGYKGNLGRKKYKVIQLSRYTIGVWELAAPNVFKDNIDTLTLGLFGGLGCYLANNDTVDIFPHVVSSFQDNNNSKILVIISDEIGNCDGLCTIIRMLSSAKIETYVMGVPNPKGAHERIAVETGGKFWDIFENRGQKDFSVLLENVASEIVSSIAQKAIDAGLTDDVLAKYSSSQGKSQPKTTELSNSADIIAKWSAQKETGAPPTSKQADAIGSKWRG